MLVAVFFFFFFGGGEESWVAREKEESRHITKKEKKKNAPFFWVSFVSCLQSTNPSPLPEGKGLSASFSHRCTVLLLVTSGG